MEAHLAQQFVEIDEAGEKWQENGLDFCTGKGTLFNPTNPRRRALTSLLQHAGLPPITFHQLRHSAATILLLKNVNPRVVPETLRHATIAITLDIYSRLLPNIRSSAVKAIDEAFSYRTGVERFRFSAELFRFPAICRNFFEWAIVDSNH